MEEMKKKPGVVLHSSGGYRYQKRYPKDVLEAIAYLSTHSQWQDIYFQYADLTFYRYDFHTKDIREANNAHAHVASKAQAFFDQVRVDYATAQNTSVPKRTALSLELATELADEIREREKRRELKEFAKDYDIVKKLPAGEQDERLQDILIDLTEQAQNYGISEHPDTIRETQRTTTQALEDAHLSHITYDQEGYGLLYGMIQNALKDASEYAVSLYETLSASQTSNLQPVAHVNAPVLSSERTVDAIERVWEEYKVRYTNPKTYRKRKSQFQLLKDYFGPDHQLHELDYVSCKAFRDFLNTLPPNWHKPNRWNNKSVKDIAQMAERKGLKVMSHDTQDGYLYPLKLLVNEMRKERKTDLPELTDLKPVQSKNAAITARDPFTINQLKTIFNAPLYTGCKSVVRHYNTPGPNITKGSRFWIPLLALWTGMRLNEICQLGVDDIKTSPKGVPFIYIHDDRVGMKLKTVHSRREVPIHPELVRCGFLHFVTNQKAKRQTDLFPDIPLGKDGYRSDDASKKLSYFLTSIKVKTAKTSTHSCPSPYNLGQAST